MYTVKETYVSLKQTTMKKKTGLTFTGRGEAEEKSHRVWSARNCELP